MTLRNATKVLLFFVLGLPLMQAVLVWVEGLLTAMGDKSAATVVSYIVTIDGALWLVALVGMVVILAIQSLDGFPHSPPMDEEHSEESSEEPCEFTPHDELEQSLESRV